MDVRMQKHRMTRWARTSTALLLVFFTTAILPAHAAIESVPAVLLWCDAYTGICTYPTDIAAGKAEEASYNSRYMATNPYHAYIVVESCNGFGTCLYHLVNDLWTTASGPMYLRNGPACPIPEVEPTAPYRYDSFSKMCVREAPCLAPNVLNPATGQCKPPESYTITIEPAGLYWPTGGSYTIEPSTMLPLKAVVKDQTGIAKSGIQVALSVNAKDGTGGHVHAENRPKGGLSCSPGPVFSECPSITTDSYGEAAFAFGSTPVSGEHAITATCGRCSNTATATVNVKVDGLEAIPASKYYALQDSTGAVIGAFKDKHPANHYLTGTSIAKLADFAEAYQKTVNPGAKLYLNDASLEWGGLFDVSDTPWSTPHTTHRRGTELDIRAENSGINSEGAVPSTLFASISKEAAKARAKAALHCTDNGVLKIGARCNGIPNNRHFHVDF